MLRNHLLFALVVPCVLSLSVSGVRAEPQADAQKQLLSAFADLKAHVTGTKKLSDEQIVGDTKLIDTNKEVFGQSKAVMQAAMDFVAAHDAHHPYLFKGGDHNEWNRGQKPGGIKWTLLLTMQYLLDYAYTPANLAKYPDLLGQAKFATADYFPGPCPKPTDPKATYEVKLWASFPKTPAYDIWTSRFDTHTARMATGAYLAPGTIATVTVPESLVGKGYAVRVGAASSDMSRKPRINRLFRISLLYPIDSTQVQVANPLGGGLYIEVPVGAHAGPVTVKFQNIVRAPFYADTRVRKTTRKQWLDQERHFKAPWADFQSEAYMMQVPTTWVYNLEDPVRLMSDWDRAVTAILYVMGYRLPDIAKVGLYLQPDTQLKHSVFSPGYPQVNYATGAEPGKDDCNGLKDIYYVTGPRNAPAWTFHEWGHYLNLPGPADEVETSNNILHVVAENLGLGVDFDKAFSEARRSTNRFLTVDNTAILWMTADNFGGGVMARLQKQYQLQGIGKYADVARLFGWSTLAEFYHRVLLQRAVVYRLQRQAGPRMAQGRRQRFLRLLPVEVLGHRHAAVAALLGHAAVVHAHRQQEPRRAQEGPCRGRRRCEEGRRRHERTARHESAERAFSRGPGPSPGAGPAVGGQDAHRPSARGRALCQGLRRAARFRQDQAIREDLRPAGEIQVTGPGRQVSLSEVRPRLV